MLRKTFFEFLILMELLHFEILTVCYHLELIKLDLRQVYLPPHRILEQPFLLQKSNVIVEVLEYLPLTYRDLIGLASCLVDVKDFGEHFG